MAVSMDSFVLEVRVPAPEEQYGMLQVRPIVDGRDVLAEAFPIGVPYGPEYLLTTAVPLRAVEEPREVELAEAECTAGCCGCFYVTIRREGDVVVWDRWRDADGPAAVLRAFRFDVVAYDAELERAAGGDGWRWRGWTVARLLAARLRAEPERLARWQCELSEVLAWPARRDQIDVRLWQCEQRPGSEPVFRQLAKTFQVTGEVPEVQAARLAEELATEDPRGGAVRIGGWATTFAR